MIYENKYVEEEYIDDPSSVGQKATQLSWNYALWDTKKSAWDDWSGWTITSNADSFIKHFDKQETKK